MSEDSPCNLNDPEHPFVEGVPRRCQTCDAQLCLRKQVINLALGNTDEMYCLQCLGRENEQPPQEVLSGLIPYISQRDCFNNQWQRYLTVEYCPDKEHCFPDVCFSCKR